MRAARILALAAVLSMAAPALADEVGDLNRQMMRLYGDARYAEATPLALRIVDLLEKSTGPDSLETASALNNLAELYSRQHLYAQAEPLYKRSLAIRRDRLGPDDPETVKSLDRLAALYHAEGKDGLPASAPPAAPASPPAPAAPPAGRRPAPRPSSSQEAFRKAVELNQQALQLSGQGHFEQALPLATESLAELEKATGPDDPNLAVGLGNLAQLHVQLKQLDKAEPLYERSIAILEKHRGERDRDLALMLAGLADLHARRKDYPAAELAYRRCLPLLEKAFGPDNPNVVTVIDNFADIERMQGKDPDAEPTLKGRWEKTARFSLPRPRTSSPDAPAAAAAPSPLDLERSRRQDRQLYDLIGRKKFAEALDLAKKQEALLERLYGPDNPAVAVNLDTQADLCRQLGRDADAQSLAKRSQAIRDANRAADQTSR